MYPIDEVHGQIVKVHGESGVTEADTTNMWTKLDEIEELIDANKAITDSEIRMNQNKIFQLEKDQSFHTSLIQNHTFRTTQLESNTTENYNYYQELETKVSSLENNITTYETNNQMLNLTLENFRVTNENLTSTTADLENDTQSNIATLKSIKKRIIELEVSGDNTSRLYGNMEFRLTNLEGNYHTRELIQPTLHHPGQFFMGAISFIWTPEN